MDLEAERHREGMAPTAGRHTSQAARATPTVPPYERKAQLRGSFAFWLRGNGDGRW